MASLNSNSITGITTTIFDNLSGVNKTYIDSNVPVIPSSEGEDGKVLVSVDGTNLVWREISSSIEYTTPGTYTFDIPDISALFYVEAMSGGEGGAGSLDGQSEPTEWRRRTLPGSYYLYGPYAFGFDASGNGLHAIAGDSSDRVSFSTDLIVWTIRTLNTSSRPWVAYANNLWFCGRYERLSTSTDTISWTMRTVNGIGSYSGKVTDVLWDGTYYIIVGGDSSSDRMNASTDAIHWVMRTGPNLGYYTNIQYENGTYVLATRSGWISTSTDGIAWKRRTTPGGASWGSSNNYKGLNYDPSRSLWLSPYGNDLRVSTDAIHWFFRTAGNTSYIYDSQTNGTGIWILCGNAGYRSTSTDTIHWTRRTGNDSALNSQDFYACGYGGGRWSWYANAYSLEEAKTLGPGDGGSGGNYASWYIPKSLVASSELTIQVGSGGVGAPVNTVTTQPGAGTTISWTGPESASMLVAVDSGSTSENANDAYAFCRGSESSTNQSKPNQSTGGGRGVQSNNGVGDSGGQINYLGITTFATGGQDGPKTPGFAFGAGGGGGSVLPDSNNYPAWIARTTGLTLPYSGVGYAFGLWTVFRSNNTYRTSTDSIHWRARTTGSGTGISNISFAYNGSDLAILGQENGQLRSTTDAIHFTARTTGLGQSSNFNFAGYLNNLFFAAGQQSNMAVSTDAIHWSLRTTGSTDEINQIAYGSGNYILSCNNGQAASSTDTIHWSLRTVSIDSGGRLEGAAYSSELGLYFISGRRSYSSYNAADFGASSTDTIHWTLRTLGIGAQNLPGRCIFADGIFTVTSEEAAGRVVTSTDVIHWKMRTSNGNGTRGIVRNSNGEYGIAGSSGFFSYLVLPTVATAGGDGFRGGGGGGGACSENGSNTSSGGNGGDGYVKITWY